MIQSTINLQRDLTSQAATPLNERRPRAPPRFMRKPFGFLENGGNFWHPSNLWSKRGDAIAAGASAMPAAATAVCEFDAATSLLPQQQSASLTPQRLCCRDSSLRI